MHRMFTEKGDVLSYNSRVPRNEIEEVRPLVDACTVVLPKELCIRLQVEEAILLAISTVIVSFGKRPCVEVLPCLSENSHSDLACVDPPRDAIETHLCSKYAAEEERGQFGVQCRLRVLGSNHSLGRDEIGWP